MRTAALDEAGFDALRDRLRRRTGLTFPESRHQELEAAVQRTMSTVGLTELERFADRLEADEGVFDALIANVTVAETYFFREPSQFDVLRRRILPDLSRRQSQLRVWSAGCATGEEPYSLAILLEQEGLAEQASILATDVSRAALARAREASFGVWSLRGNPGGTASPYFDRQGDRFQLKERFRRRVEFRFLNLASDAYPSIGSGIADLDLILCRNVLIYFDQAAVQKVGRQLFAALREGGWLLTGPSDPPLWDCAPFQTRVTEAGVLYQRAGVSEPSFPVVVPMLPIVEPAKNSDDEVPSFEPVAARVPIEAPPVPAEETDETAWMARIRALADRGDAQRAEEQAVAALRIYPLSPHLHYLHAIVHAELGRYADAVAALRRVIYLDPTLVMAHFTLGALQVRTGAVDPGQRSFRNALALCRDLSPDATLPLSEGEPVRNLVASIEARLKPAAVGAGVMQ